MRSPRTRCSRSAATNSGIRPENVRDLRVGQDTALPAAVPVSSSRSVRRAAARRPIASRSGTKRRSGGGSTRSPLASYEARSSYAARAISSSTRSGSSTIRRNDPAWSNTVEGAVAVRAAIASNPGRYPPARSASSLLRNKSTGPSSARAFRAPASR